jgi:hypothetical protein
MADPASVGHFARDFRDVHEHATSNRVGPDTPLVREKSVIGDDGDDRERERWERHVYDDLVEIQQTVVDGRTDVPGGEGRCCMLADSCIVVQNEAAADDEARSGLTAGLTFAFVGPDSAAS